METTTNTPIVNLDLQIQEVIKSNKDNIKVADELEKILDDDIILLNNIITVGYKYKDELLYLAQRDIYILIRKDLNTNEVFYTIIDKLKKV